MYKLLSEFGSDLSEIFLKCCSLKCSDTLAFLSILFGDQALLSSRLLETLLKESMSSKMGLE